MAMGGTTDRLVGQEALQAAQLVGAPEWHVGHASEVDLDGLHQAAESSGAARRAYHRRPTRSRMSVVSSRVAPMRVKITSQGPLVTSSG